MDPERQSVLSVISFFLARSSSSLADLSQSFLRETPSVSSSVESSLLICDAKYAAAPATAVTTPTTFPAFASHSFAFCSRLCLHSFLVCNNLSAVRADTLNIIQSGIIFVAAVSANMTISTTVEVFLVIQISIKIITEPKNIIIFKFVCRKLIPAFLADP